MWQLALVYDEDNKRYLIPFEIVEKLVDERTLEQIKVAALKEVQKQ